MLPKWHVLFGAIFSIIVAYFFSLDLFQASLIFLSSVLIDFDHYLWFVFNKQSISLSKSFKWFKDKRDVIIHLPECERESYKRVIFLFHGIEFWLILSLLSLLYKPLWFVLIGVFFHMILDYIDLIYIKEPLYSKFSQLFVFFKNKGKRKIL